MAACRHFGLETNELHVSTEAMCCMCVEVSMDVAPDQQLGNS